MGRRYPAKGVWQLPLLSFWWRNFFSWFLFSRISVSFVSWTVYQATSNWIFLTRTKLSNVTALSLSMIKVKSCFFFLLSDIFILLFQLTFSSHLLVISLNSLVTTQSRPKANRQSHTDNNPPRFNAPVWNLTYRVRLSLGNSTLFYLQFLAHRPHLILLTGAMTTT